MIRFLFRTSERTADAQQTYTTRISHLGRSLSVQVILLIGSVARGDFLEANRQREEGDTSMTYVVRPRKRFACPSGRTCRIDRGGSGSTIRGLRRQNDLRRNVWRLCTPSGLSVSRAVYKMKHAQTDTSLRSPHPCRLVDADRGETFAITTPRDVSHRLCRGYSKVPRFMSGEVLCLQASEMGDARVTGKILRT